MLQVVTKKFKSLGVECFDRNLQSDLLNSNSLNLSFLLNLSLPSGTTLHPLTPPVNSSPNFIESAQLVTFLANSGQISSLPLTFVFYHRWCVAVIYK